MGDSNGLLGTRQAQHTRTLSKQIVSIGILAVSGAGRNPLSVTACSCGFGQADYKLDGKE